MTEIVKKHGYYWNYHDEFQVLGAKIHVFDSRNNVTIYYDVSSNTSGSQTNNFVTLDNIAPIHLSGIKEGCPCYLRSGCPDLYGQLAFGKITKIVNSKDDSNHTSAIYFDANADSTKSKSKKQPDKIKHAFDKNTKAKTIISYIKGKGHFNISRLKLKKNKSYPRGYSINEQPYHALQKIVQDCGSVIYRRNGGIIIDDNQDPNPFGEHLYLDKGAGLLSDPQIQDGATNNSKNKNVTRQWQIEAMEDVRINAGSAVYIKPLKKLCRVQSAHHTHSSDGYKMELIVS